MKTLNVEHLQVESFATELDGDAVLSNSLQVCTQIDCPSQAMECTTPCIAPSGATDYIRCCG
jgi:hypothetical protein